MAGGAQPRKAAWRRRGASATVLALSASVLCASSFQRTSLLLHNSRLVPNAFVAPHSVSPVSSLDVGTFGAAMGGTWNFESDATASSVVGVKAMKGFAPAAATEASSGIEVEEPAGGWPTISVIVLSPDSKDARQSALVQLAYQDYPKDRIKEVVVSGAIELGKAAPEDLKGMLTELRLPDGASLRLHEELAACTGDIAVLWGDDQVSPSTRLRSQVAAAAKAEAPTVLKQHWFFDYEDYAFHQVTRWPVDEFREAMESAGSEGMPDGFGPLMVTADPLTLCGQKEKLAEASKGIKAQVSPTDAIKELLLKLLVREKPPLILDDLPWAVGRAPPSVASFEAAKPPGALVKMAHEAWPRGKKKKSRTAFDDALTDVQTTDLTASAAITRLLSEDTGRPLPMIEQKRVKKAVLQCLARGTGADVSAAIATLTGWEGLEVGNSNEQHVRNYNTFYAAFTAVRAYVEEDADLIHGAYLGEIAQGLVVLAKKMWAADPEITEVLVKITSQELVGLDSSMIGTERDRSADYCGTLALRKPMEAISYAALDMPEDKVSVSSIASLAWGLAEAGVENGGLQMKVAKLLINGSDKLTPPDIGYIFNALHERRWFKDSQAVAYLTQALVNRVQDLKKNDPGIANHLAAVNAR